MEDTYVMFILVSVIGITVLFVAGNHLSGMMGVPFIPPSVVPTGPQWHLPAGMGKQGPVGLNPEICNDGVDNDYDSLVDCKDVECMSDLACRGGCRVDQYNWKKPGQKICREGSPAICQKVNGKYDWVAQPCPAGKKCYGDGLCR